MPESPPLRWLYLDLNSYFASVQQQLNPALRGKAIAVGPEAVDSGTIIAASYPAKAFGVKTGMRVGEAKRLCPDLIFVGGDHRRYVEFHDAIVAEIWKHVPVTAVCSIDEVACRLLDNENAPAQALALARRIKAGIRRNIGECLTSSVGIAPSRLVAKIAADMQKPDGLTLIPAAELPQRLFSLPLSDVPGIGRRMEARLAARGITTMAQWLSQGPTDAAASWGSVVGARLWYALHGQDMPERPQQSRSIGHSHVLMPRARDAQTARLTARHLLMKAASRLRRAECVASQVTLSARFAAPAGNRGGKREKWSASLRIAPTDDSFSLIDALDRLWPGLAAALQRNRIHTIAVSFDDIRPAQGQQLTLFEAEHPARATRALSAAMDQINARFGRHAVMLGPRESGRVNLIGAKIAFGRIPDAAEFHE